MNYCYDPQKQLDNAIVQWETMTNGLTSFTIQHRKVSLSSGMGSFPSEYECNRLRYEISYDLSTEPPTKELIRLLDTPGVQYTSEECQGSDKWDEYYYTPMVTNFPTIEQWFAYVQNLINELKGENKEGWHNFIVNYDRTYGYPTMMHFTSGSAPSDEIPTSSSPSNFRYFHHEFRKFKPQF